MAWYSIGDWFSGANTGTTQSQSEAQANTGNLLAIYKQQQQDKVDSGELSQEQAAANFAQAEQVSSLNSTTGASVGGFVSGATEVFTGADNGDGTRSPGLGTIVKDVLIVAVIAGVVWLFVEFGGAKWFSEVAKRMKYGWALIIGVVLLVAGIGYYFLKKTASDTGTVASNVFSNPIKTLFGT